MKFISFHSVPLGILLLGQSYYDPTWPPLFSMSTVIIGGGIIGLSTAYYLCRSQSQLANPSIHIVDSSPALLTSASGYAGGFLALDWFTPAAASLGALSFRLHRELARENDGQRRWGYAGSHVYSLSIEQRGIGEGRKARGEDWLLEGTSRAGASGRSTYTWSREAGQSNEVLNDDGTPAWITPQVGGSVDTISSPEECAQVEPKELCDFLLAECEARGVKVHLASRAIGVLTDGSGFLRGLKVQSTNSGQESIDLECKKVVLAAGAWTPKAFETLFPQSTLKIPIDPLAGHSIVYKSPRYKQPFLNPLKPAERMCYAIFCPPGPQWSYAPEAFARLGRNGETEVWLGGLNDSSLPLPDLAIDVKGMIDKKSIDDLRRATVQLTGLSKEGQTLNEDDLDTIREGLCFRPVSRSGSPILAKVQESDLGVVKTGERSGVWIASGHGPWGISLSLGSGLVMSEMLEGKKLSADVEGLGLR